MAECFYPLGRLKTITGGVSASWCDKRGPQSIMPDAPRKRTTKPTPDSPAADAGTGLCWFCERKEASKSLGFDIDVYGNEKYLDPVSQKVYANRPPPGRYLATYDTAMIHVPRCASCRRFHARTAKRMLVSFACAALVFVGCPLVAAVMGAKGAAILIALAVGFGLTFAVLLGFLAFVLLSHRWAGIRREATLFDHPDIKAKRAAGWQTGTAPPKEFSV